MRTLSIPAAAAAASEEQSDPILLFVELDLGGAGFIRIVNNWEAVTRDGNEHSPYHFEISLPDETTDAEVPSIGLRIDNIDQIIIAGIQLLTDPIPVTLGVALFSSPDTTEAGPFDFLIQSIEWDAETITAQMTYETLMVRAFPHKRFIPIDFPGAF